MLTQIFEQYPPITQALIGGGFSWLMTTLGAATIFLFAKPSRKVLDGMLGFAAGVMIAASFWSLLAPAIRMSEEMGVAKWFPAVTGFLAGGIFLRLLDFLLPHIHPSLKEEEGIHTNWRRSTLLVLAVTIHNIPEGLAIGVAFGASAYGLEGASIAGALALAVGIGIQDYPEGFAVSMPLRSLGVSRFKSFALGTLSGLVEPLMAVVGVLAVVNSRSLLPYALSFAAGAMIFVTAEEVIPEAQSGNNPHIATTGVMLGFAIMMFLETFL